MKLTLFRLTTLVVSTLIGLTAYSFKKAMNLPLDDIPPIQTAAEIECGNWQPYLRVVISVPANDEFYLGKRKLVLPELCERVEREAMQFRPGDWRLSIKSAPNLRFESVYRVISRARECGINGIDLIIDKKKRGT
jgi:biopolymer transport protein ExbD